MTYGDGGTTFSPLTSLDVAGHEMSHGVTAATDGPRLHRRRGRPQRGHLRRDGHDGGVLGQQRQRPGRLLHRREDRQGRHLPAPDGQPVAGRRLGNCWSSTVADARPALLLGRRQPPVLPARRGHRLEDHRRPRAQRAPTCNGTTLTGIGRDQAAADLVPRDDDLLDLDDDLPAGRQRHGQGRQGPVRRDVGAVHRHRERLEGRQRHPHRDLRWHHASRRAATCSPTRASSRVPRHGRRPRA